MKEAYRQFIRDLKASCLIGDSESIGLVLMEWTNWPVVTSNQAVPESFLDQIIIPAGQMLAGSSLSDEQLMEFQKEDLAAWRLLAAGAAAFRWARQPAVDLEVVEIFARDPRADVRSGFTQALLSAGQTHQDLMLEGVLPWLKSSSNRQRETALKIMAGMETIPPSILSHVMKMNDEEHPDVRSALVELLEAAERQGHSKRIGKVFETWQQDATTHPWLLEKTSHLAQG